MDYQKKAFEVEISNGGPRGYETAITLKLPATWAEFHDALQKARIPDGRNCGIELTRSWWAGLSSELIGGAQNLYAEWYIQKHGLSATDHGYVAWNGGELRYEYSDLGGSPMTAQTM